MSCLSLPDVRQRERTVMAKNKYLVISGVVMNKNDREDLEQVVIEALRRAKVCSVQIKVREF